MKQYKLHLNNRILTFFTFNSKNNKIYGNSHKRRQAAMYSLASLLGNLEFSGSWL
jgi:hypothetical protein